MLADDVPAIAADAQGLIVDVNDLFLESYGWEKESLIGAPLTIIIPEKFHDAHNLPFPKFFQTGQASIFCPWIPLEIVGGVGDVQVGNHFMVAAEGRAEACRAVLTVPEG